jgi:hypothetical protein
MITLAIKAFLPKSSRLARLVSDVWGAYNRPPASFSEMLTHYRTARLPYGTGPGTLKELEAWARLERSCRRIADGRNGTM